MPDNPTRELCRHLREEEVTEVLEAWRANQRGTELLLGLPNPPDPNPTHVLYYTDITVRVPEGPDPWDADIERAAIMSEPPSIWWWLRHPQV